MFIVLVDNRSFFERLFSLYPLNALNAGFLLSIVFLIAALTVLLLCPFLVMRLVKPVLILVLLLTAVIGYFGDQYGVIFDSVLLSSILQTHPAEALELLNPGLVTRVVFAGLVPAFLVYLVPLEKEPFLKSVRANLITMSVCVILVTGLLFSFSTHYTSFFREHKETRMYVNPLMFLAVVGEALAGALTPAEGGAGRTLAVSRIQTFERPTLVVLIVGEAARVDHLSINDYERRTTPELENMDVVFFPDVNACGTATAISVPCMFSPLSRKEFSLRKAAGVDNLLDVLAGSGVRILWRDNNSDSKGVAAKHRFEDFSTRDRNARCDDECRDTGMLDGLDQWISQDADADALIVLHQMGSHGPAYYRRYPPGFERFTPVCRSVELSTCSRQEIINAYDNSILYTDYFLGRVVEFLVAHAGHFRTTMIYVGDHGESLGEYGLYLHGIPYALAPEQQTRVPMLIWFNRHMEASLVRSTRDHRQYGTSHDDLFPSILHLFGIRVEAPFHDRHFFGPR